MSYSHTINYSKTKPPKKNSIKFSVSKAKMSSILNNHVIGRCPLSAGQPDIVCDNKNYCIKNVLVIAENERGSCVSE